MRVMKFGAERIQFSSDVKFFSSSFLVLSQD